METVHKFLLFYLFSLMNSTPIIPASISLTCAMSSRQLKMYFLASLDLIFVSPSCSSGVCKKLLTLMYKYILYQQILFATYLFKKIYSYDDYSLQILFFQLLEAFDFFSLVAKLIQISRAWAKSICIITEEIIPRTKWVFSWT